MENKPGDEATIKQAAGEIEAVLKKYNLGMQPVIQVFKLPEEQTSFLGSDATNNPVILQGNDGDMPPALMEMLKPVGDEIRH